MKSTKANVQFQIELDKNIYTGTNTKTRDEFFNQFVLMHVASDYNFISKGFLRMNEEEKEKYAPYLQTLKEIKQNLLDSVQYELIEEKENIETIKVSCHFNYYENNVCSLTQTVDVEIFNINIKNNYFLEKDIVRVLNLMGKHCEDQIKMASTVYKHVGDFLTQAKKTVFINDEHVDLTS